MAIKIEAAHRDMIRLKILIKTVDSVLEGGDCPSEREVLVKVQKMLGDALIQEVE